MIFDEELTIEKGKEHSCMAVALNTVLAYIYHYCLKLKKALCGKTIR